MLSVERREEIKNILLEKKNITVADMASRFNVSAETIRRDLNELANEGFLKKTYGGASYKPRVNVFVPQRILSGIRVESKQHIASTAAQLVQPNDCIFLDHSTTVYEICPFIINLPLTVMTNSLIVINFLSHLKNIHLVTPGGNFNINAGGFFGFETIKFLQNHNFDKAFLSCRALDMKRGLRDSDELIAETRKSIIKSSTESYLLADSTKIGQKAFVSTAVLSEITGIITDAVLDNEWIACLKENHVKYIQCSDLNENKSNREV